MSSVDCSEESSSQSHNSEIGMESPSDPSDIEQEDGYDTRQDSAKEEEAEELSNELESYTNFMCSEAREASRDFNSKQVGAQAQFMAAEIENKDKNGKALSYSKTKVKTFTIDAEPLPVFVDSKRQYLGIANQILSELRENEKLFHGLSEMRRRIDIDTVIRLVFKNRDNVSFTIEGEGATVTKGKIDYIAYINGRQIGVIEAKSDDKTMAASVLQLHHEMMAIKNLSLDQEGYHSFVFGFLTDGKTWTLHLSDYSSVKQSGNYNTNSAPEVANLVAALHAVVLNLDATCNPIFYRQFEDERLGIYQSKLKEIQTMHDYACP